jgi:dihydrodipicolinate synthase/N-acetylneuraminate lyase
VAYAVLLLAGADGWTGGTTSVTPRRLARCIGLCVATGDVTDPTLGHGTHNRSLPPYAISV